MNASHHKTVFIDRNSGGRLFKGLIQQAGISVVLHDEEFRDPRTPDQRWLKVIGQKGWVMVTGDKATCRSYVFLATLKRTTAYVFALDSLNCTTAEKKARCIIEHYPEMVNLIQSNRGPRMWQEHNGKITEFNFRREYARMRRAMGE